MPRLAILGWERAESASADHDIASGIGSSTAFHRRGAHRWGWNSSAVDVRDAGEIERTVTAIRTLLDFGRDREREGVGDAADYARLSY